MSIPAALSLDSPWSLGEDAFAAIVDDVTQLAPQTFVEFGAGRSSVRFAQALPTARILSVESDPRFFPDTEALARTHVPDGRLTVTLRPLTWQEHGSAPFLSYAPGPFPDVVDAVLVDGPPRWTGRGREAALYQVIERVRVGGRIYLDDHQRKSEQQTVANWLVRFPAVFDVRFLDVGHGVAILEKRKATAAPARSLAATVDGWRAAVVGARADVRRRLGR
jgi:hypothetical protein